MKKPARGITVIGSDTEIGKTFVSSMLLEYLNSKGVRVGAYKPVASGICPDQIDQSDPARLASALRGEFPRDRICPQQFSAAKAPSIAAGHEALTVDRNLLTSGLEWWESQVDVIVVETVGGLLSPIDDGITNADLAVEFGYPCLLVAPNRLGAVHQCLATLESAERFGLDVIAVVLNQTQAAASPADNASESSDAENRVDTADSVFDEHFHLLNSMRTHPQIGANIPSHIFHLEHEADFLAVRFTDVIESVL